MGIKAKIAPKNHNFSDNRYLKISEIRIIDGNIDMTCLVYENKAKRQGSVNAYISKENVRIYKSKKEGSLNPRKVLEGGPLFDVCYKHLKENVEWIQEPTDD